MPLEVDERKCNGCGICEEICPVDAIRLDKNRKPYLKYDECWYCDSCEIECPEKALKAKLPYLIE